MHATMDATPFFPSPHKRTHAPSSVGRQEGTCSSSSARVRRWWATHFSQASAAAGC